MKTLSLVAALSLLLPASFAHAKKGAPNADQEQWTCDSSSSPMIFEAKIYKRGDRYFADLYQLEEGTKMVEDNDGDVEPETLRVSDDAIELQLKFNNERGLTFVQIANAADIPKEFQTNVKPSNKSRGTQIFISAKKDAKGRYESKIKAERGPFGERVRDTVACW